MEPREQDRIDVRRVLDGDVDAFEGIVLRWQGPLVTLAYRFCRHQGRAEEMAQEAFLRAFRGLDQWRGDAAFSTWLFAVATNVYRSEIRRKRPAEVLFEYAHEPGTRDKAIDGLEHRDTNDAVRRVVSKLPPKYRDAVVLFYFSETNLSKAAERLEVPVGTLKNRLHRARALIKERLSRNMGETALGKTT